MLVNAQEWHSQVKRIFESSAVYRNWRSTAPYNGRLIPLCTPVPDKVNVLVIGLSHSEFDPKNQENSERIASAYSASIQSVNTFLSHRHHFAVGLHRITHRAGIEIDSTWVGTNRCPIQTGPNGLGELEVQHWFQDVQGRMDDLLKEFVRKTSPKYVLLFGVFAARLFYSSGKIREMIPSEIRTERGRARLIPLWHPSRATFDSRSVERMQKFMDLACCE